MEQSRQRFDLVIVGGGIVGLTLAACLKPTGLQVAIVEAQPFDVVTQRQRAYAMSPLSQNIFQALGIWEAIAPHSGKYRNIQLSDEDFAGTVRFSRQDLQAEFLGFSGQHRVILEALQKCLADSDQTQWFCPAQVRAITYHTGGARVQLSQDGQDKILDADLVVGADGPRSFVRRNAGIKTRGWKYPQSCVTCIVEHAAPRNDIAFERFWGTGPMGVLPLPGNRCQIVWTNPHHEAKHLQQLPEAQFLRILERHAGPQLGPLHLVSDRQVFPVQLMQGDRYVQSHLALIGDAAHCCHPVGGQGLNLGLRDAAALAEILTTAHQHGEDLGSLEVLTRYGQWRHSENMWILGFTDVLNRTFSSRFWPVVWLRRLGLILLARINPFRLLALEFMTGQKGRLPYLGA